MPARNEALTIATNVAAARACAHVREVIVVDDGSTDGRSDEAGAAGAKVVRRDGSSGSKALAMRDGVAASGATATLCDDADCTGVAAARLDGIVRPVVEGQHTKAICAVDYGW